MPLQLLSVLDQNGKVSAEPPSLGEDQLLLLHRTMVRNRKLDERAMLIQRQGGIGFYVPSFGEEACSAGAALALEKDDWVAPSYRQPGIPLMRGISAESLFDNCWGNDGDAVQGRQMPVHYSFGRANLLSISSPIGTQIIHAVGVAMAMRYRKTRNVCMTYLGDGGTSSNDFHSGMNFAGVFKAPAIIVCVNNQWAISCNVSHQTGSETIAQKAVAYGMPGVRVDGNDVLAVYEATRQAVARARSGDGPTFLEFLSFRMGPHSSSDDPSRYRPRAEEEEWARKDPIKRFEAFLLREGILDQADKERIHGEAEAEMADAAKAAQRKSAPSLETLFDGVYDELPPHIAEQRNRLLSEGGKHSQDPNAAFPL